MVVTVSTGVPEAHRLSIFCRKVGWLSFSGTTTCALACAATSNVFLTVKRIERDDMAGDVEFTQEFLGSRDLVRLVIDLDMSQHEGGIDGKGAENLGGLSIIEVVEAVAEGLAVQRDPALLRSPSGGVEPRSMSAKHRFDRRRVEPLKGVADRGVGRCLLPGQTERGVQAPAMDVQER